MQRLSKQFFQEKWKSLEANKSNSFIIGKLYTLKESLVIKRLQAHNIIGCAFKTNSAEKKVNKIYIIL